MPISWIQSRSFIDFERHISCVIGFADCNLDCEFCSNWRMTNQNLPAIPVSRVKEIIMKDPVIDAIVLGGGEPSTDIGLMQDLIFWARRRGLEIAVQTNGLLIDQIAPFDIDQFQIDLKLFLSQKILGKIIKRSRELIDEDKLKFTTVLFDDFDRDKLRYICKETGRRHIEAIIGRADLAKEPFKQLTDKSKLKRFQGCLSLRFSEVL